MEKIGVAKEELIFVNGTERCREVEIIESDIIIYGQDEPHVIEGDESLVLDAVFPCPCCGKRIKTQIREKIARKKA